MLIGWDEPKRAANLFKHGMDFATVHIEFFFVARILAAKSGRFRAIGFIDGTLVAVIFARLGSEAVSIISLRPASAKERNEL